MRRMRPLKYPELTTASLNEITYEFPCLRDQRVLFQHQTQWRHPPRRRPRHPPDHRHRLQQPHQPEPQPSHRRPRPFIPFIPSLAGQHDRAAVTCWSHRRPRRWCRTSPPTRPAPDDANAAPHATPDTSTPATAPESNPTPPPPTKRRKLCR